MSETGYERFLAHRRNQRRTRFLAAAAGALIVMATAALVAFVLNAPDLAMKLRVKLLIVQITSDDVREASKAFEEAGREVATAVTTGCEDLDTVLTIGNTRTHVRMKLEKSE